jgi:hypothetical protein
MSVTYRFRGLRVPGFLRRDHRREMVGLLAAPSAALRCARRKADAGRALSRAEWIVVADCARHGIEAAAMAHPQRLSPESLTSVLDAFAAVYDVRTVTDTRHDPYYLSNLPIECRSAGETEGASASAAVRAAVAETRRRVRQRVPCLPWLAARNLGVLLADGPLPGAAVIHRALRRYWLALWPLAVHGHHTLTGGALPWSSGDALGAGDGRPW